MSSNCCPHTLHSTGSSVDDLSRDDEDEECGDAEGSIEELIYFSDFGLAITNINCLWNSGI
jgi:hypothetical protein